MKKPKLLHILGITNFGSIYILKISKAFKRVGKLKIMRGNKTFIFWPGSDCRECSAEYRRVHAITTAALHSAFPFIILDGFYGCDGGAAVVVRPGLLSADQGSRHLTLTHSTVQRN